MTSFQGCAEKNCTRSYSIPIFSIQNLSLDGKHLAMLQGKGSKQSDTKTANKCHHLTYTNIFFK